jgi:hypothetical protein
MFGIFSKPICAALQKNPPAALTVSAQTARMIFP